MADDGPSGGEAPPPAGPTVRDTRDTRLVALKPLVEMVGLLAAQLSVLGSVLVYFGTVATRVEAGFFGVDAAELDYSNQELVFRSIAPMLGPLAIGGAVAVFALQIDRLVGGSVARVAAWPRTRPLLWVVGLLGLALLVMGAVWQWRLGSQHSYWSPLYLAAGAVLVLGARGTAAMARAHAAPGDTPTSPIRALDANSKLVLGFVLVFAVFGFTARLAQADGYRRAVDQVTDLDRRPTVSVLAEEPLIVNRSGVVCFEVTGSRFTRRYVGLHLIAARNDRYYLVPTGFDTNNGAMIVLDRTEAIRIDHDATPQLRDVAGLDPAPPLRSPDPDLVC